MTQSEFPFVLEEKQPRFCVTCKHCFTGYTRGYLFHCGQKVLPPQVVNNVVGTIAGRVIWLNCFDQRAEVSHIENKCGPEGKFWEPKS